MRRLRILQIVPTYLPATRYGGPIYSVHGLARGLAERGHDVHVFATNVDGHGRSSVPLGEPVLLDGVKVWYFSCPVLSRLYWAPSMGRALKRDVGGFDIVHLHSVFLWPTWAAARAARRRGVPYVLSPRGMLVRDLIARRSRFIKTAWIELIERTNLRQAAAIHVTSELEATELEQFRWQLPPRVVIGNAIDEPFLSDIAVATDIKEVAAEQPLVVFLGRLSWKKGLDRLLYAFARTRLGTLAIAGTDDEIRAPWLKKMADELGIAGRVRILPRTIAGADKEKLLAAAQVSCSLRIRKISAIRFWRRCGEVWPLW